MMGIEEDKKKDNQGGGGGYFFDPYGFGGYGGGGGGGRSKSDDSDDTFRVDADVQFNRLLLWCNELELGQVRNLLIELGEMPVPGGNQNRRRVYEVDSLQDAMNLIDKLEKAWPSRGSNKLEIIPPVIEPPRTDDKAPVVPLAPDKLEIKPANKTAFDRQPRPSRRTDDRVAQATATIPAHPRRAQLFGLLSVSQLEASDDEDSAGQPPAAVPPAVVAPEDEAPAGDAAPPTSEAGESATDESAVTPMPLQEDDPAARFQRLLEQLRKRRQEGQSGNAASADPPGKATVHIRIGPNGTIYLESDDTYALDMIEEVMDEYAPPKRDWKVIPLKYPNTWAYGIEMILHDVFEEEIEAGKKKKGGGYDYDMFLGFVPQQSTSSGPRRMSRRKPLKIISDRDSHTILVQGASDDQMHMIEELIAIYDKPESTEAHAIRKTQVFKIRYSQAKVIGEAVKDVYRDLLSENDRALQQEQQGRGEKDKRPPSGGNYTYIYGTGEGGEGQAQEKPIRFKGLLSIGIDPVSNILIVSASEGLLQNVGQIIEALDESARPNSAYQVMQVDPRVNTRLLQERLSKMFGPKAPQPNQQPKNPQGQPQPGQNLNQPSVGAAVIN